MRIFSSFTELIGEIPRDLVELGIEVRSHSVQAESVDGNPMFDMKEIIGYAYRWKDNFDDWDVHFEVNELEWISAELLDRISFMPENPGTSWTHRPEVWESMLVNKERFHYTYNERIRGQLLPLIEELRKRPNTRQAIITIYDQADFRNRGGLGRVPCSMSYQFFIREEKLHVLYHMRSCDLFTHLKFDIVLTALFTQKLAERLGIKIGTLTHFIGSLHCFRKDWEKARIW